jgi:hypothetical protein
VLRTNADGSVVLQWKSPLSTGKLVTTELLGKARIPDQGFENPDGSSLKIDRDYFRQPRSATPNAGPFENIKTATISVWPKK